MNLGKNLIIIGFIIALVGAVWMFGEKFGLGKLPGDITIKGDKFALYLPITTCVIIGISLSLILWLIRWFKG